MAQSKRFDIAETVTATIIAHLESMGDKPEQWTKPWVTFGAAGWPHNVASKKGYRGINVVMLGLTAHHKGYTSDTWGTYKQWEEIGAQVRKGEKSTLIVFYKLMESTTKKNSKGEATKFPMLRYSSVFNADQVDGYTPANKPELPTLAQRVAHADRFVSNTKAKINHVLGDRAFYRPSTDDITLPLMEQFKPIGEASATETYYGTLLHELVHWSGHKDRTDRHSKQRGKVDGDPGRADYAFEELVAEIGAAMLCKYLNIEATPRKDHSNYIATWLKALRNDKNMIIRAASQASAAGEYLGTLQTKVRMKIVNGEMVAA